VESVENVELTLPHSTNCGKSVDSTLNEFTPELFSTQLRGMKSGTSAGASGWSADAIKRMCSSNPAYQHILFGMFQAMIRACLFPKALFTGTSIGLWSTEKKKARPITIDEPFDKLMARCLIQLEREAFSKSIPNTQFGIKTKFGGEKIIAIIQMAIDLQRIAAVKNPDTELFVIATDISGAYNNVPR
jgi:hypothetical protein